MAFDFEDDLQTQSENNEYFIADTKEPTTYDMAEMYNNYIESFWKGQKFNEIFSTCFYIGKDDIYMPIFNKNNTDLEVKFLRLNASRIGIIVKNQNKTYNEYVDLTYSDKFSLTIHNCLATNIATIPDKLTEYRKFAGTDIPYIYKMLKWYANEFLKRPRLFDGIENIILANVSNICLNISTYMENAQMPYDFLYPIETGRKTVESHPNIVFDTLQLADKSVFLPIISNAEKSRSYYGNKNEPSVYAPGQTFDFINQIAKKLLDTDKNDNKEDIAIQAEPLDFDVKIYCKTLKFKSYENVQECNDYLPRYYKSYSDVLVNYGLSFPICEMMYGTTDSLIALSNRTKTAHEIDVFPNIKIVNCRMNLDSITGTSSDYAYIFEKLSTTSNLILEISNYQISPNCISLTEWDYSNRVHMCYKNQGAIGPKFDIVESVFNNLNKFSNTNLSLNFIQTHLYQLMYMMPKELPGIKETMIYFSDSHHMLHTKQKVFKTYSDFRDFISNSEFLVALQENAKQEEIDALNEKLANLVDIIEEQQIKIEAQAKEYNGFANNLHCIIAEEIRSYMSGSNISYGRM